MEVGPTRTDQRKRIIAEVLQKHGIDEGTLLGPARTDDVVDARIEAAHRLRSAGFPNIRIAEILKRDRTVIWYYFDKTQRENHRDRLRLKRRHRLLPDDVRAVVNEFAKLEKVAPWTILSEWITERARYELEARARDARTAA